MWDDIKTIFWWAIAIITVFGGLLGGFTQHDPDNPDYGAYMQNQYR